MSANALDSVKKLIGAMALLAAAAIEIFWPEQAKALAACTLAGGYLLGLGAHSARGRALEQALASLAGPPSEPPKQRPAYRVDPHDDVDEEDLVDTVPDRPAAKRPPKI